MSKKRLDRWIHLNMAMIGGFLGGFAILNHHELFGSAQTSNLISIFSDLAGHPDQNLLVRLFGVFLYMVAMALTVILPKYSRFPLKQVSLLIDALAIIIVGLLPAHINDFIALYPLYVAMAIQWCSFKGADGFTCSSIFSTNNLRQFTTSMTEYLCTKDKEDLRKGKFFGKVLLSFHIGVIFSYLSCQTFDQHGTFLCIIPLCTAFFLLKVQENWIAVKHKIGHAYLASRRNHHEIEEFS